VGIGETFMRWVSLLSLMSLTSNTGRILGWTHWSVFLTLPYLIGANMILTRIALQSVLDQEDTMGCPPFQSVAISVDLNQVS
jgi:hypothetical protein